MPQGPQCRTWSDSSRFSREPFRRGQGKALRPLSPSDIAWWQSQVSVDGKDSPDLVSPSRPTVLPVAAALAAGVALGVAAPLLGTIEAPVIHSVHLVLSAGWSWAALAFCVGAGFRSRVRSAVVAGSALTTAVVAYYVTKLAQGDYREWVNLDDPSQGTHIYWAGFLSKTLFWGAAAVVLGLLLGLAGNLGRNSGLRGLAFRMLIPLTAIAETSMRLTVEAPLQSGTAGTTWNVTRLVAIGVIVLLSVQEVRARSARAIRPAHLASRSSHAASSSSARRPL
ncbi:DUF6518 family protein [Streptomyces griseorubiginosus]|uniref:DUF6518 family protein n=1 Tax=Streptomyces griseorubiginosus TaxID=67304 RepID=UPI002E81C3FE|nr:DUF6518 family protein [Streptomyces griseorubiginosus]WUB45660.1 DUF6518 family protein [Streptomyces griseorubiginosus]WUB54178.1 DUF6518 family protein [Streptomyces griseorubiginosus]